MKSINGTYVNGHAVPVAGFNGLDANVIAVKTVPDYVPSGTVTLASGETVQCMEVGRTKNGYAKLILQDGREIKTDPAMYREAGSFTPFFEAFPYAVPGMVPYGR